MTSEPKRVVVTRPDPPEDEPKPKPKSETKLSPEEVRALLAVTTAAQRTPLRRAARRGLLAFVPTTIVSVVLDSLIGWWSIPVLGLLTLAWVLWPLLRQSRDGWT